MSRLFLLLSPSTWTRSWVATFELLSAIKHLERREYERSLRSFECVLARVRKPDAAYLAFHAYLLLLNGSLDTYRAWERVTALAQGDVKQASRYAAAVARYYLAQLDDPGAEFQHWREARSLQPSYGVLSYIRLPEMALAPLD